MAQEHTLNSGPAGLAALAVACFGLVRYFLVWSTGRLPLLAAWLFGGCLVQYTTAVMELKEHNILGGNVFMFFSAFFMLGAAISVLSNFFMLAGAGAFIPKRPQQRHRQQGIGSSDSSGGTRQRQRPFLVPQARRLCRGMDVDGRRCFPHGSNTGLCKRECLYFPAGHPDRHRSVAHCRY